MTAQYSFLGKDKTTEPAEIDPGVQKKINLGIYVTWGFAGLLLIYAFIS